MGEEWNRQKALAELISIEVGNIADREKLKELKIDAVVNAANPTLMGSDQGVDSAIHKAVDTRNKERGYFNRRICEELHTGTQEKMIRCKRGEAVVTQGYGLCPYVIHAVGAEYDGAERAGQDGAGGSECGDKVKGGNECSSSMIHTLECCYEQIVARIMEHSDIRRAAIPIIGSGHYKVPFRMAFQIAASSIYNALLEWKQRDSELFEVEAPDHIYFFIYDETKKEQEQNQKIGDEILNRYRKVMDKENRIVFQTSWESHFRCLKEIQKYDHKRGYFSVARFVRLSIMWVRVIFFPLMGIKDLCGKEDWTERRKFVERFTMIKAGISITACILAAWFGKCGCPVFSGCLGYIISVPIIYFMSDTITYLLALILLADIQGPSANVTRSIILLFVNYIEVSFAMAYLYLIYGGHDLSLSEAVAFGISGIMPDVCLTSVDEAFRYVNDIIKFFFLTIIFGYFSGHMHQKKFRS